METVVAWSDCLRFESTRASAHDQVPKLTEVAGDFLSIRPWLLSSSADLVLPNRLYQLLLSYAVKNLCYETTKALIANYPSECLSLGNLGLKAATECADNFMQRTTTTVVRAFIETLEEKVALKLTSIDLRGYPLGGPGLAYLAVQSLLSYKEAERRKLVSGLGKRLAATDSTYFRSLNPNLFDQYEQTVIDSLPNKLCHFFVDGVISSADKDLLEQLCLALKTSNMISTFGGFQLIVSSLQLCQFPEAQIAVLLDLLDQPPSIHGIKSPQNLQLTGLALHYCELSANARLNLHRFPNLSKLEVYGDGSDAIISVDRLMIELSYLNSLRRLSLSALSLSNRLANILSCCQKPLEFLTLDNCKLLTNDIDALSWWPFIGHIKWLDLSKNRLDAAFTSLSNLLRACSGSLQILVLRDTRIADELLDRLANVLLSCQLCTRVDLVHNQLWNGDSIVRLFGRLAVHQSLEEIAFDMPFDTCSYLDEEGNHRLMSIDECYDALETLTRLLSSPANGVSRVKPLIRPAFLHYSNAF